MEPLSTPLLLASPPGGGEDHETPFGAARLDALYLRRRGFEVERSRVPGCVRVGRRDLSIDEVRAMAARERGLDNGVEGAPPVEPSSLVPPGRCPVIPDGGGVEGAAPAAAHDLSVPADPSAALRTGADSAPRAKRVGKRVARRSRPARRVERDLCDVILDTVAERLDEADDGEELLIIDAVRCVHAAATLLAVLPDDAARAAVVRELRRWLPEIVERRVGELRRGGRA